MNVVELSNEAVVVRARWRRSRTYFYEEIAGAAADGNRLAIALRDGHSLRPLVGRDRAGILALELETIVNGSGAAIDRVVDLETLRQEVSDWGRLAGFSATPFVDFLLKSVGQLGSSDLHLEPRSHTEWTLSMRLHGTLHHLGTLPPRIADRVVGRLKVLSGLQVHRHDMVQEGRVRLTGIGGDVDVRTSFVPAARGEAVTLRLFDRLKGQARLSELGFSEATNRGLLGLLDQPRGLIVVSGPSASGKTTTLYTLLRQKLAQQSGTVRAISVEDPVEYQLSGVTQLEAGTQTGASMSELLRAALRQDATVLVVGEIRDIETATLAVQAGLTGHLVLTTIHAGSIPESLTRLLDFGVQPAMLASALAGVVCQRLLRLSCNACQTGCSSCNHTGWDGRIGVAQLIEIDSVSRSKLAVDSLTGRELVDVLMRRATRSLCDEAMEQVTAGATRVDEVERVI